MKKVVQLKIFHNSYLLTAQSESNKLLKPETQDNVGLKATLNMAAMTFTCCTDRAPDDGLLGDLLCVNLLSSDNITGH